MTDLTKSMEQSPSWKVNYSSTSQGIPHILWNPNFHYCIHSNLTLVCILSHVSAIHDLPSYFCFLILVMIGSVTVKTVCSFSLHILVTGAIQHILDVNEHFLTSYMK